MILHFIAKRLTLALVTSALLTPFFHMAWATENPTEKWYEIEVIVFNNTDPQLQTSEKWPENPGTPNIHHVLDLFTETDLLFENVEQLPMYYVEPAQASEDSLSPLVQRILSSKDYSLLTHRTWRQTLSPKKNTIPVYLDDNSSQDLYQPLAEPTLASNDMEAISAEQLLLEALLAEEANMTALAEAPLFSLHELDPIVPFDENALIPDSTNNIVELSPMGPPKHSLFGTLRFFKNRYLHVGIDFSYRPPPLTPKIKELPLEAVFPMAKDDQEHPLVDEAQLIKTVESLSLASLEKPPYIGYRLKESKRIRLNEIHYFDHPLYGVIVRATTYQPPESTEENLDDD